MYLRQRLESLHGLGPLLGAAFELYRHAVEDLLSDSFGRSASECWTEASGVRVETHDTIYAMHSIAGASDLETRFQLLHVHCRNRP